MTRSRLTVRTAALATLIGDRWPNGTEARLVAELGRALPRAISVMALAAPDGWPTSTPGAPDRGGSASSGSYDRLGGLVARRERPADSYAALSALLGDAAASVALQDRQAVRKALRAALTLTDEWHPKYTVDEMRQLVKTQRCTAKADDPGYLEWSRPECENVATRHGLCDACAMRRRRWAKTQDGQVA